MEKTLGRMCFEYRARNGISQVDMAKLCKVHTLTIIHCEQEKPLRKTTAYRIASIVNEEV